MAAPVRDRIELDAVRELHLVLLVKTLALLGPLCFNPLSLGGFGPSPSLDLGVVVELVLFGGDFEC